MSFLVEVAWPGALRKHSSPRSAVAGPRLQTAWYQPKQRQLPSQLHGGVAPAAVGIDTLSLGFEAGFSVARLGWQLGTQPVGPASVINPRNRPATIARVRTLAAQMRSSQPTLR